MDTNQSMTMTIAQAAKALDVDPKTIRRRLISGRLTGQKISGRWLIDLDSIRTSQQSKTIKIDRVRDIVHVPRRDYEGVLFRLGQLETERQALLEHKQTSEALRAELQQTKAELENLRAQQQQGKKSLFGRVRDALSAV